MARFNGSKSCRLPSLRAALAALTGLALAASAGLARAEEDPAQQTPVPGANLPRLFFITPGTRIDAEPPPGWTHLVVKSVPRLASGEIDTIPEPGQQTAALFRTFLLADVRRPNGPAGSTFALRRVGIGVCVPHEGHDVVVTASSLQALGIELGSIAQIVLDRTDRELAQGRLIARTPTFALYRAPMELLVDRVHRKVLLNYALLVDLATGELTTATWWVDAEAEPRPPAQEMVLLKPGLVYECKLDVTAGRLLGAVPVSWSFAMQSLPPGTKVALPPSLKAWTARDPQTHAEARELEAALRGALGLADRR